MIVHTDETGNDTVAVQIEHQGILGNIRRSAVGNRFDLSVGDHDCLVFPHGRTRTDKDVFNGDVGIVERIDTVEQQVAVRFDERLVKYDFGELDEISLAYAITIPSARLCLVRARRAIPGSSGKGLERLESGPNETVLESRYARSRPEFRLPFRRAGRPGEDSGNAGQAGAGENSRTIQIGRASCRERV